MEQVIYVVSDDRSGSWDYVPYACFATSEEAEQYLKDIVESRGFSGEVTPMLLGSPSFDLLDL